PAFGGFVNFDIIGSEEGSYLYQSIYFAKDPILSISLAGTYQADALRTLKGLTNQRSVTSTLFFDLPLSEQLEFVAILGGYLYGNGTGSSFGAQSINAGNAGYAPFVPAGQQPLTSLGRSASKSLTLSWNCYF